MRQESDCATGENIAINGEYLFNNNFSVYLNSRLSEEPFMIGIGSRYYLEDGPGYFADISFINRNESELRKYVDFNLGGGYLLELNDYLMLDFKTGYTITPSEQDNYASLSLGVKFSLANLSNKNKVKKIKEPNERMKILKAKYPSWQKKTIKMIVKERIAINMNTTQILESWGEPGEIEIKEKGKYQKWTYNFKNKSYILYFVDKRLKKWKINKGEKN